MAADIITSVITAGSNNHTTTSEEANAYATDFVSQGVVGTVANTSGVAPATGSFAVNQNTGADRAIAVTAGRAYITGTPSGQSSQVVRAKMSSTYASYTINANSSGSTKYDWVYLQFNATTAANPSASANDVVTLYTSRSSSSSTDDGSPPTYGILLAVVTVSNGASAIVNANISDRRTATTFTGSGTASTDGWTTLGYALTYSANNGNKEYVVTTPNDLSGLLSAGMRLRIPRSVTPPTQCTDLESSSSQYASKTTPTGISFTDDFTGEAWVKLESYGTAQAIISRYNGTSGWQLYLTAEGQVVLIGYNGGAGNNSYTISSQIVPLDTWVHVAAVLDMSTFTTAGSPIYINGVSVPVTVVRGGTNPTALIQAGNLQVGAGNSTLFFDGKLADVRLWSTARTAAQIRDNMNQQLVGSETNLVAYFKLNGDFNDSTSNANNLTVSGGALATSADNPMKSTEYGIVTSVSYSNPTTTIKVFTGTESNIPNGTLGTISYSTHKAPYGFPTSREKWSIKVPVGTQLSVSTASTSVTYSIGLHVDVPTGDFTVSASLQTISAAASVAFLGHAWSLSTSTTALGVDELTAKGTIIANSSNEVDSQVTILAGLTTTALTRYYVVAKPTVASATAYLNPYTNIKFYSAYI